MKKNINILLTFIVGLTFQSCNLDTSPTGEVDQQLVFATVETAETALNGTWAYLIEAGSTQQNPGWNCLLLASDAMGNDVAVNTAKYGYGGHYQFNNLHMDNTGTVAHIWNLAYRTINGCNNILAKIDDIPGDNEKRKTIKGQALALRGYIYLNLATFYQFSYEKDPNALCVPIYTEPTTSKTEGKAESPLKDVYARAISDLKDAYDLLASYNRDKKYKYKIDRSVVSGLLARTYLQMGANNWETAEKYAKEAHSGYSWMQKESYLDGFNNLSNEEWIWGQGQTNDQKISFYVFAYKDLSSPVTYYYSFMADPYFKDLFDTNDIRYKLFKWDTSRYKGGLMYDKFRYRSNTETFADLVLMRKAEMVLIEAECLAEQNKLPEAIAKLNDLRNARGANTPDLSALSKADLVEEILVERRKELYGEGFSLSDILRRQKSVVRKEYPPQTPLVIDGVTIPKVYIRGHLATTFKDGSNFEPNSPYYLIAIPQSEKTNNPNLVRHK